MRSYLLPVAVILSMSGASLAMASTPAPSVTDGVIKALSLKHHHITLASGTVYTLPAHFKAPALKVGEKVSIAWQMVGKKHEVSSITVVK